ncbi:venom acid phosphatase Acph-1-like [Pieris brassicae]|uniref:venom acid phosphatase Acph-1-like n=1 Tax=Pieris brassicae TaxID=7116 RepID=UPI001E66299A|nr:venom acid phosphatase Acph-1-like [Pieris brassicae]
MYRYIVLAIFVIGWAQCNVINEDDENELIMAFVVNRHGERTPDSDELSLSDQQEKIKKLTIIEGLEGLTNTGKRRAYQIGKFIRQRYGSQGYGLLSNIYLQDEIMLRSTDKERTKMTAQMAMAAVYPPDSEQQWDDGLGKVWQPVPYTAVPLKEDYLRYYSNCKRFKDLMAIAKSESLYQEFRPYTELFKLVQTTTGKDFSEDPLLFETLFDLFKSQVSLGLDIPNWAKPVLPKLGEAAKLAYRLYYRTEEMRRLGGGVILNDFIETALDIINGKNVTKRFHMYSAHDFNIGSLMEVTGISKHEQPVPEYGAVFGLELFRSRVTGDFSVLPIYLAKAGESSLQKLHFTYCDASGSYCNFDKFRNSTRHQLLPEWEFYSICDIRTEL